MDVVRRLRGEEHDAIAVHVPSAVSRNTIARPMPAAAPVTIAARPNVDRIVHRFPSAFRLGPAAAAPSERCRPLQRNRREREEPVVSV